MARPRLCGLCGEVGHRRDSCPNRDEALVRAGEEARRRRYEMRGKPRCSFCTSVGHNVATCPDRRARNAIARIAGDEDVAEIQRLYHEEFLPAADIADRLSCTIGSVKKAIAAYRPPPGGTRVPLTRSQYDSVQECKLRAWESRETAIMLKVDYTEVNRAWSTSSYQHYLGQR